MSGYVFPPTATRELLVEALPEESDQRGKPPDQRNLHVPESHWRALHPDAPLVEGIRGSGKTVWWGALASDPHRQLLEHILPRARITRATRVSRGFGEAKDNAYPDADTLAQLAVTFAPRILWRTVIAQSLLEERGLPPGLTWAEKTRWVLNNPEPLEQAFRDLDTELAGRAEVHLVLFDALYRTAREWPQMRQLLKGLLENLLDFRSYQALRLKAFVRPDMLEDPSVAAFPDSSKLLNNKVELLWPPRELYSLLWQYLGNAQVGGEAFRRACETGLGFAWSRTLDVWIPPSAMRSDEGRQKITFHGITGQWMGRDARRGFPYTWLPNHLADARRQTSPRSFLSALRHAALQPPRAGYEYALHYEDIKRGVQRASQIRVTEMQEDYHWVQRLMNPLQGLSVPCAFAQISERWVAEDSLRALEQEISDAEVRLPPQHLANGPEGVRRDLEELGIFERMSDGRVNMPDVYRVGYGIGRRGGVKAIRRT